MVNTIRPTLAWVLSAITLRSQLRWPPARSGWMSSGASLRVSCRIIGYSVILGSSEKYRMSARKLKNTTDTVSTRNAPCSIG